MARRFPGCLDYLEARREELERRRVTGGSTKKRQFYQFGRSQSLTKFNIPKIILPILSVEARYAYDDNNIVVTGGGNGPYYMIRGLIEKGVSDLYLLAVLNHPLSEAIVRTNTSSFQGGYYSHGKQYIENLPVPIPTTEQRQSIEEMVNELLGTQDALATVRLPHQRRITNLRNQLEERMSDLFGLSKADMDIVRAVPLPS